MLALAAKLVAELGDETLTVIPPHVSFATSSALVIDNSPAARAKLLTGVRKLVERYTLVLAEEEKTKDPKALATAVESSSEEDEEEEDE